ncbi:hypothetical protein JAAARDRAFT_32964 [Jaapia argillacea MUCL 33604]|uniref:Uncharacterized protein n=1 Tax=Jaapia argillacea MUCL 33604 TaxID=933084 RepID=A0A067Q7E5_9AGAM|nr:hypothetical protein JAAARDRAFT_32964 [Jaapia argillacea MUCL 33604]
MPLSTIHTGLMSRRAFARILSTFLCSTIIAIRPFSRLGGPVAFLVLTVKELVFSVQEDLAQQLELTVFNIVGALFGVGLSTLAKYIASRFHETSVCARAIPALFLVGISFVAGLLKSRLPRLQLATRISCFVAIWTLTGDPAIRFNVIKDATDFLWISISAAVICLVSAMLLLRWSSTHLATEVAAAFSGLRECLSMSLDRAFAESTSHDTTALRLIHEGLLKRSIALNAAYARAAFELRIGRLSVKSIKSFIGIVEHLRRELSWGMSFSRANFSHPECRASKTLSAFQGPVLDLGHALLLSMNAVERVVLIAFDGPGTHKSSIGAEAKGLQIAGQELLIACNSARLQLQKISDEFDIEQRTSSDADHTPQGEFFDLCLFMISMIQMAHDTRHAIRVAQRISTLYESTRPRLWYPRLSSAWLGVAPRAYVSDDDTAGVALDIEPLETSTSLSEAETQEGLAEQVDFKPSRGVSHVCVLRRTKSREIAISWRSPSSLVYYLWSRPLFLHYRVRLSKILRSIQHSPHFRHAFKNALGVALLSIPAFMSKGSAGRDWFTAAHGQWMIVSYVWVLETNTGATWRVGYLRISGTIVGAIYAYMVWVICKTNPYGIVVMVTASDIPVSWLIMCTNIGSLGTVAAVTIPPIVFTPYLQPSTVSIAELSLLRGLMIGAGIVAALVVNHFIFPRHCRMLFLLNTSRTLRLLSELYLKLSRDMFQRGLANAPPDKFKTLKLELEIRSCLHRLGVLITTMNDELSLLPKPMRMYRQVVSTLQKVLDLFTGLRKVRENIPRKETVTTVFKERRELVSCVCITLFACEHAFRARQPIPQFLPSARHALQALTTQVDESIHRARDEDHEAMGLSLVYAYAETEVMHDMVTTIEELLESTQKLFGTSAWLTNFDQSHYSSAASSVHEDHQHGWYSTLHLDP